MDSDGKGLITDFLDTPKSESWRGGSNECPQSIFKAEIRKIVYTPVNPSFTIYKWGLRGSKLYLFFFILFLFIYLFIFFFFL